MGLGDLLKDELKALCVENDLPTNGTKSDLTARLEPVLSWDSEEEANEAEEGPIEAEGASEGGDAPSEGEDGLEHALSDDEVFITELYEEVFGHGPDLAHLNHYTKSLRVGAMNRDEVTNAVSNSMEALRLRAEQSEDE
jgi:hypothetical protein